MCGGGGGGGGEGAEYSVCIVIFFRFYYSETSRLGLYSKGDWGGGGGGGAGGNTPPLRKCLSLSQRLPDLIRDALFC